MSHQTRSTLWRTLAIVQVVALVLTSFMLAAPAVYAAPAPVAAVL